MAKQLTKDEILASIEAKELEEQIEIFNKLKLSLAQKKKEHEDAFKKLDQIDTK